MQKYMINTVFFDCNKRLYFWIWFIFRWRVLSAQPSPYQALITKTKTAEYSGARKRKYFHFWIILSKSFCSSLSLFPLLLRHPRVPPYWGQGLLFWRFVKAPILSCSPELTPNLPQEASPPSFLATNGVLTNSSRARAPPHWDEKMRRLRRDDGADPLLLITAPSSILGPLHSDTSHLISSVHQDCPLKVRYLHFLHDLPIQGLVVAPHHLHGEVDVLLPLVVVDGVQPQYGIVHISWYQLFKVLFSSWVGIPSCLSKIGGHLLSTFLAIEGVNNPFSPATASPPTPFAWKTIDTTATFFRPWIWSSEQIFQSNPTFLHDFEANFSALVVLGFSLFHSFRQLSIWSVRNKEWDIEAPSCEPVLLLEFFLFLPLIFIPCSSLVDWPPTFFFCNPSLGIFSVWQI